MKMPTQLTGNDNYYEDFTVGDIYKHVRGKTITELDTVLLTNLAMNTAQIHFNEDFARNTPMQHRVTFGGVTASIIIGLASQDTGENALMELELNNVRFKAPVYHGDTLYAFTEVLEKQEGDQLDAGIIHFRHWGVNQDGKVVFEGERRVLMKRKKV